eukprot:COSAG05_NODE_214_length_13907_cov_28.992178_6_plen_390_part_00
MASDGSWDTLEEVLPEVVPATAWVGNEDEVLEYERVCFGSLDATECGMLFVCILPAVLLVSCWCFCFFVRGAAPDSKDGFTKVKDEEQSIEVNQTRLVDQSAEVHAREKEVSVDWHGELGDDDAEDARLYAKCQRAAYTTDPSTGKRVLIDMQGGYTTFRGSEVHSYPTLCTSLEEMTSIGGVGIRVYFELLWRLPCLFFVLALLNTPSLYLNYNCCEHDEADRPSMYENRNITRQYRTSYAKTTLGSLAASREELDEGKVGSLYVRTLLDGLSIVVFFCFVIHWTRARARISEQADLSMASMSDYTIRLRAKKPWDASKQDTDSFKAELEDFLGKYGQISTIGGAKTIELAYAGMHAAPAPYPTGIPPILSCARSVQDWEVFICRFLC